MEVEAMPEQPSRKFPLKDPVQKEYQDCAEDLEELELFQNADLEPIRATENFKKNLRAKLWGFLKNR